MLHCYMKLFAFLVLALYLSQIQIIADSHSAAPALLFSQLHSRMAKAFVYYRAVKPES